MSVCIPVSERRQRVYEIPVQWGISRARLMQEVRSDYTVCQCHVCGKDVSSFYSFTECDEYGAEVVVGRGCFRRARLVE